MSVMVMSVCSGQFSDGVHPKRGTVSFVSRRAMISQYCSSVSTPMAALFWRAALIRVAPDPAKGSAMVPGGQRSIRSSISGIGFGVGCPIFVRSWDRGSRVVMTDRRGGGG
jgi:hypothetical protein